MDFLYGLLIILGGLFFLMLIGLLTRKIFFSVLKFFGFLKYLKHKATKDFEQYEEEKKSNKRTN